MRRKANATKLDRTYGQAEFIHKPASLWKEASWTETVTFEARRYWQTGTNKQENNLCFTMNATNIRSVNEEKHNISL